MKNWKRKTRAQRKALYRITLSTPYSKKHRSHWGMRRWGSDYVRYNEPWGSKIWRDKYWRRKKQNHKDVDYALAEFAKYQYIEDCRYHPCKVTKVEHDYHFKRVDFECESVVNGTPNSCSYFHCGIVFLTEEEANERACFIKAYGMLPYQLTYIYSKPPSQEKLELSIRFSRGQEEIWKFSQNSKVAEITESGKTWLRDNYQIIWDSLTPLTSEEMENAWSELSPDN